MHACDEMVIRHLFSLYLGINSKEPCWILFIELPFIFIVTGKIKSSSHLLPQNDWCLAMCSLLLVCDLYLKYVVSVVNTQFLKCLVTQMSMCTSSFFKYIFLNLQSLECLVRLASVRRSLFTNDATRSKFLDHLMSGTKEILRTGQGIWIYGIPISFADMQHFS